MTKDHHHHSDDDAVATDAALRRPFRESYQAQVDQIAHTRAIFEAAAAPLGEQQSVLVSGGGLIRPLLQSEITTLESCCYCQCKDWSKLRLWLDVDDGNDSTAAVTVTVTVVDRSGWLEQHVSHNTFEGTVVFRIVLSTNVDADADVVVDEQPSSSSSSFDPVAAGIHHNLLITNCIFNHNCRVYRNSIIKDTYIGIHAVVLNNGQLKCMTDSSEMIHGELELSVGPESGGGRKLRVQTESTMMDVCRMLGMSRRRLVVEPKTTTTTTTTPAPIWNTIGNHCIVRDTPTLHNLYMAPHARIAAATLIDTVVMLSDSHIDHASTACRVLLQWNASITHSSHVSDTLLMEEAHAGPHSLVASSILGPDVHVSAGEVHASVIGPQTNAHHQSLVIGVLWPLGRGNVGYGANVGSNHTGRLPDQETLAAEGAFWGLSTVIKFPVDLSFSPYSLIAAGTTVVPQRIVMPFSLVVDNDIIPGWVLRNSPYTLSRSATKFATRRKATRHDLYTGWEIMRPHVMNICLSARRALQNAATTKDGIYRGDRAVAGIGKAVLSEKGRLVGIQAYTDCVRRYALLGLLQYCQEQTTTTTTTTTMEQQLEREFESASTSTTIHMYDDDNLTKPQWPILPWEDEDFWNHQKAVLLHEFPRTTEASSSWMTWMVHLLSHELVPLEQDYANRIYTSKQRDDMRGEQIIPAYEESHVAANDDPVIQAANAQAVNVERAVQTILARINSSTTTTSASTTSAVVVSARSRL